MRLRELVEFSFARGEEVVLRIRHQEEAVNIAINRAFSEHPGQLAEEFWQELMSRVNRIRPMTDEDIRQHNQRAIRNILTADDPEHG